MWVTGPYTASILTSIQALDLIRTKDSVYDTYCSVGGGNWWLPSKEMRYILLFHPLTNQFGLWCVEFVWLIILVAPFLQMIGI